MSRYELLIGRRYLRSGRGNRFVSLVSIISMVGMAIGVAVLIVVLSVMNGFEVELRERMLSMTAHASISGYGAGIDDWQALTAASLRNPEVLAAAPYIEDHALLIARDRTSGASLVGILPAEQSKLASIQEKITEGSFEQLAAGEFGIVLGAQLAEALGVVVGGRVVVATSTGRSPTFTCAMRRGCIAWAMR
jgi:lipoprotein-releasing system permease protein